MMEIIIVKIVSILIGLKINLMYIKKIFENHEHCNIEMPSPNNNIIKYNQGENR